MAKNNNLTDLLTSVANAIRTKKGTSELINPQNFDAEIINIEPNLQAKTATPTTSSQTIVADSGYDGLSEVQVEAVTSSIDSNITASNIKKDVTILGVTGTLESGGGTSKLPQVVDRSVTEITADDLAGITSIGIYAFYRCSGLASITIPDSVTSIGGWAFQYCTSLTSITIPDSVIKIEEAVFQFCTSLTSVTIPNSVTSIGTNAFSNCKGLTSITIPEGVTAIRAQTFVYCTGLTSITIPENINSIQGLAFYGCDGLTTMTIKATTPPELANKNAISTATTTIYIPAGTLEAYQTATNWSNFADKFVELSA